MKSKVYMRVARNHNNKATTAVSKRPTYAPIYDSRGEALPTVAFALELDIPDELFRQASAVIAEISVRGEKTKIAAEVAAV